MTSTPSTRCKTYRDKQRAKLERAEEMFRMLQWIAAHSTDKAAQALAERTLAEPTLVNGGRT